MKIIEGGVCAAQGFRARASALRRQGRSHEANAIRRIIVSRM